MKTVLLAAVSVVALASSSFAQPATQSPTGNLEKLSSFQSTGTAEPRPVAQEGRRADAIRKQSREDQASGRIQDRSLCDRARCAPHGCRSQCRRGLRRHAQEQCLCRHGPRQGSGRRRGEAICAFGRVQDSRTASASRATAFSTWRSRTACCNSRPPSSSTKGRMSPLSSWPSRAISFRRPRRATTTRRVSAGSVPDNKLYIALGQPFNVPPKDKLDLFKRAGIGGIVRMDQDGKNHEVYATGDPQFGRHGLQSGRQDALVHRQPGRRHGRRSASRRAQPHRQGGTEFRLPLLRRRHGPHGRVQGRSGSGRRDRSAGRNGSARGRSRHDVLHRKDVPRRPIRAASSRPSTAPGTAPSPSARASCSRRSSRTARPTSPRSSPRAG